MRKSFKFKLYQNKRKNKKLQHQIEIASEVWNYSIECQKNAYSNQQNYISKYDLQKRITQLKKTERFNHWKQLNSQAVQQVVERVDRAYQRFFKWAKARTGSKMLPPKFKSRKKYKSVTFKTSGWKYLGDNKIVINKVKYKFHQSREILGDIKTITIKRDSLGDYWITFSCDNVEEDYTTQMTGNAVGVDFGLKTFLTLSDATEVVSPEFFKDSLMEIKQANHKLSSKRKGSNNRKKAKSNLSRLHRKIANHRSDYHWKLARYLVSNYDIIAIEDLNIAAMKRLWGRKISDLGFSEFINKLEYLADKEGKQILKIDRWYPSSKTCFNCGNKKDNLALTDRTYHCDICDYETDRDLNASWNILAESGRVFPDRLEGVRLLFGSNSWLTLESNML